MSVLAGMLATLVACAALMAYALRAMFTWCERRVAAVAADKIREIEVNDDRWRSLLATERAATARVAEIAQFGGPRAEPEIASRMEDMHEKLEQRISEETIARGVATLRDAYRDVGITPSDDELREEVLLLASGHRPQIPRGR